MQEVNVVLDGVDNGFAVEMSFNDRKEYFLDKNGNIKKFRTLEMAKVASFNKTKIGEDFHRYYLFIGEEMISYNYLQKVGENRYEIYISGIKYIITETPDLIINYAGYFVFENGDVEQSDHAAGLKKCLNYMRCIRKSATKLLMQNTDVIKIQKGKNGNFIISLLNSTGKICVSTNANLMEINQERKKIDTRCIPYIKSMDKYTTIPLFCLKDFTEPLKFATKEKMKNVIMNLCDIISEEYDVKFVETEYNGIIRLDNDLDLAKMIVSKKENREEGRK